DPPTASDNSGHPGRAIVAAQSRPSIAVLAFTTQGADVAQGHVAEALVDDIITALSRARNMFVIARASDRPSANQASDPIAVARELGVRYVVAGSMRRDGDAVLLNVRLLETDRGAQLWAEHFGLPQSEGGAARGRVVVHAARALGIELFLAESRRELPDNPDAVQLAIRAYALVYNRITPEGNEQARQLFEAALARDGNSVLALVGVAEANLRHVVNEWRPSDDRAARLRRADEALLRATALEPRDASARAVRGTLLRARGEPEQAIAAFEYAIQLDPSIARAHAELGRVKMDVGRATETIGHVEEAMQLSPRD